jgi:N-sulfoglucosamine sulfohydrolase
MFLSDHGMPFPFVKTQLYHHSTLTPLIFRWPGIVQENTVDDVHMVSAIDILPTLLDSVGAQIPKGIEGRSLLPLMRGESQDGWDRIFKEYAENSSGQRAPMRAIETKRFLYIFNPWSNGKRRMTSATMHMNTYKRMVELAEKDEKIASRLELLTYRVVEELYDVQADPDCLVNLIADPKYQKELIDLRFLMATWMRETQDPALNAFDSRTEPKALAEFMTTQNLGAQQRREWKHAIRDSLRKANTEKVDAPERVEPVPTQP